MARHSARASGVTLVVVTYSTATTYQTSRTTSGAPSDVGHIDVCGQDRPVRLRVIELCVAVQTLKMFILIHVNQKDKSHPIIITLLIRQKLLTILYSLRS